MKLKLTTFLLLSCLSINAYSAGKFAFVNPAVLLQQAPQAINATASMQAEFGEREANLRKAIVEVTAMEKKYQNDRAIMSDDQKSKMESEIIQRKRQFQFDQKSLQEDVEKRRGELIQEVQQAISEIIREYGASNGYDFIFSDGVAFASESVNITEDILKELKK